MGKMPYHHGDLKTAILDAAEHVMSEKSLDAISMRELARQAKVSPGAPYHHFVDRTGLVTALCQRGFSRLHEVLIKGQKHNGIKGMIAEYLKFAQQNSALYQLMFSAEATDGNLTVALHPFANPVYRMLEEEIGQEKNLKANSLDNMMSISVWCFMHGLATLSVASPLQAKVDKKNLDAFAYEIIAKLIKER